MKLEKKDFTKSNFCVKIAAQYYVFHNGAVDT